MRQNCFLKAEMYPKEFIKKVGKEFTEESDQVSYENRNFMPKAQITRRQKNISRLLREKRQAHKDKLRSARKKKGN